jgi:hypothetical protein
MAVPASHARRQRANPVVLLRTAGIRWPLMARFLRRLSQASSSRFRALDRRLHIDHSGRSEWIWAVPILTFAGTLAMVVVAGAFTSGAPPALYVPIGMVVGVLMAGMSVAYMTPEEDHGEDGDGGSRRPEATHPPAPLDWWRALQGAQRLPRERPRPRRRDHAGSRR